MTDRELLELAAKAVGFLNWTPYSTGLFVETGHSRGNTGFHWNPLVDDGDALRLAVKCKIDVVHTNIHSPQVHALAAAKVQVWEDNSSDPYTATRRAIVRAAAEIGRNVP